MKTITALLIALVIIIALPLSPIAAQGIPKGPAADKEIDRVAGKGTAAALNRGERTCEALSTFARLFLSYADNGDYTEALKLFAANPIAPNSAADLAAYLRDNAAFGKQHKRADMFDCALNQSEHGGRITIPITAQGGGKYTIEFEIEDRLNRLSIRRLFAGKTFP